MKKITGTMEMVLRCVKQGDAFAGCSGMPQFNGRENTLNALRRRGMVTWGEVDRSHDDCPLHDWSITPDGLKEITP